MARIPSTPEERRALFRIVPQPERLRREVHEPDFVHHERTLRFTYRHRTASGVPTGRYRRSRWEILDTYDDGEVVMRHKEVFCWVMAEQLRVGAISLEAFECHPFIDPEQAWELADGHSADGGRMWEAIRGSWEDPAQAFLIYGEVVWLRDLWMWPERYLARAWVPVLDELLACEFPHHSALIARAFPTEYLHKVDEGSPLEKGYSSRMRAIVRHLTRVAGMRLLPGAAGAEGWMWRPAARVADVVDEPDQSGFMSD